MYFLYFDIKSNFTLCDVSVFCEIVKENNGTYSKRPYLEIEDVRNQNYTFGIFVAFTTPLRNNVSEFDA